MTIKATENNPKTVANTKKSSPVTVIICTLCLFMGYAVFFVAAWYRDTYGDLGFDSIIFTLTNGLNGVQDGLVMGCVKSGIIPAAVFGALTSFLIFQSPDHYIAVSFFGHKERHIYPFKKRIRPIIAGVTAAALTLVGAQSVSLISYIVYQLNPTRIFDSEYVDPLSVDILFPEQKRNLIYIYMESIETTFTSEENGGALEYDLIPELRCLAEENISFSNNDSFGGYTAVAGTNWTVGSMVAHTAGIPLKTPFGITDNTYGSDEFLPGAVTLFEILKENGYYQSLMVGSDARFANRDTYYKSHGVDKIYDYYTALEDEIIPEGYSVWWGMEDKYLYEYAKHELTEIASKDQPFAFTMLTVDTHHVDGYLCSECGDEYDEQYENVIACASRQLGEFISWLSNQDFYENTTVVIVGDHPTMDKGYINRNVGDRYDRHVYNCIINSAKQTDNTENRCFAPMDMFPTTLSALGCEIEGGRLGLGTDLFSDRPTLMEEMGVDEFMDEMTRSSDFYNKKFLFVQ